MSLLCRLNGLQYYDQVKTNFPLFQMLTFLENNPKGVYNVPNVEMRPPNERPKIKDRNSKYPAIANCISFK